MQKRATSDDVMLLLHFSSNQVGNNTLTQLVGWVETPKGNNALNVLSPTCSGPAL
jgi:hypothetical protein